VSDQSDLLERARAWADEDPDQQTRAELGALVEAASSGDGAALADLADRFAGTLEFGTAGLRGALGAGPNRMNRVVVIRAAAGLAAYLRDHGAADGDSVVIGYDARHNSDVFARDTAEVMTGAGLSALVLPRPLPTPLLAFAIRDLGAVAGVMVTASHNPPRDNGYKVFLPDGSQIVSPIDVEIAAAIDAVDLTTIEVAPADDPCITVLDDGPLEAYLAAVPAVRRRPDLEAVSVAYTPMHGVGAAIPTADGGWRRLTGDELGWLLAEHLLRHTTGADRLVVTTLVSSSLLGRMAEAAGVHHAETFTGFKWIAKTIRDRPDEHFLFGYEQALGYLVADAPRDKDGITAAVLMAEVAALARAEGVTLQDRLDDLARRFGRHLTAERSLRMEPPVAAARVAALRADPPAALAGRAVDDVVEFPEANLLRLVCGRSRVQVRPSGTEPKVKVYGEGVEEDPTPLMDAVADLLLHQV
jgi:phosphomannomutase